MRQIGMIANERDARALADHLLTLDITTRVDPRPEGWAIWVHREERVEQARRELAEFLKAPNAPKYHSAAETARVLRKKAQQEEKQHLKNTVILRDRWTYRPPRRCFLTLLMIAVSVAVSLLSGMGSDPQNEFLRRLSFASYRLIPIPQVEPDAEGKIPEIIQSNGLKDIERGEVWRLVTPIFLHFGPLHLLFNMLWLYDLGGLIEMRRGHLRMAAIVLTIAAISSLAQYLYTESPLFGGMSGVVFGLFGYVWMKSRYDPAGGMYLHSNTVSLMILWLLVCMTGRVGPIANAAHLVGLIVGMVIGFAPHIRQELSRW